jgi:hypothetical protein
VLGRPPKSDAFLLRRTIIPLPLCERRPRSLSRGPPVKVHDHAVKLDGNGLETIQRFIAIESILQILAVR